MPKPLVLLALSAVVALSSCKPSPTAASSPPNADPTTGTSSATAPPRSHEPPPREIWQAFNGKRAFADVRTQVELGPRPAGSTRLEECRQFLEKSLTAAGWLVERQPFDDQTPRGPIKFINLIARFPERAGQPAASGKPRFIVASHYDTKLFDTIRFVGADDGASSTGALLELARVLALDPSLAAQIELVFFDGEEAVSQFTATDGLYGSRHYARVLRETKRNQQFIGAILWDMIGDRDLTITLPPDSPTDLAHAILDAADKLGSRANFSFAPRPVLDDHVPLIQAKIPAIDLIDFDYLPWHTADDTLDKLSPESLQTIGAVTLYYLHQRLQK